MFRKIKNDSKWAIFLKSNPNLSSDDQLCVHLFRIMRIDYEKVMKNLTFLQKHDILLCDTRMAVYGKEEFTPSLAKHFGRIVPMGFSYLFLSGFPDAIVWFQAKLQTDEQYANQLDFWLEDRIKYHKYIGSSDVENEFATKQFIYNSVVEAYAKVGKCECAIL